ncbi:MAG: hypothetical protein JWM53_5179, partial [bacterium]|nr:hypothetical protein [bacterium]
MNSSSGCRMTTCPVCNGQAAREVRRVGEYKVRECERCGLHWSDPMRAASVEWYAGEGAYEDTLGANAAVKLRHVYGDRLHDELASAEWLGPNHLAFLAALPHRGGSLLDIGCGEGTFLVAAEPHYSEVQGIELDPNAVARAQRLLGARVQALTVEEIQGEAAYDVVTMF